MPYNIVLFSFYHTHSVSEDFIICPYHPIIWSFAENCWRKLPEGLQHQCMII